MVQLCLLGKGGEKINVDVPLLFRKEVASSCPHGCDLTLQCTGEADRKVGICVRQVFEDGNVSSPVDMAVPVDSVHRQSGIANSRCPGCGRHLALIIRGSTAEFSEDALAVWTPKGGSANRGQRHAYVATLWPPREADDKFLKFITKALVLGHSLSRHCRVQNRVLLVTDDVWKTRASVLLNCFWDVRTIQFVEVHPSRTESCEERFKGVFTKLRAWDLEEYDKAVLLDIDMLVLKNIDDLFGWETPAAVFRGHENEDAPGSSKTGDQYFSREGDRGKGGINAGVIVLRPSSSEFRRMALKLQNPGEATNGPEQDFLSDWYFDKWLRLPVKHNYQLHQLRYLEGRLPKSGTWERADVPLEDVTIAHFSGKYGPDDYLFDEEGLAAVDFNTYLQKILLPRYGVSHDSLSRVYKLCNAWYLECQETWKETIARVHKPWRDDSKISKCPACSVSVEAMGLTFEHAFQDCKGISDQWQIFVDKIKESRLGLLKSGLREILLNDKVFKSALFFVAEVASVRIDFGSELFEERKMGEMPTRRCLAKKHTDHTGHVMLLDTAAMQGPQRKGRGKRHGGNRGQKWRLHEQNELGPHGTARLFPHSQARSARRERLQHLNMVFNAHPRPIGAK